MLALIRNGKRLGAWGAAQPMAVTTITGIGCATIGKMLERVA